MKRFLRILGRILAIVGGLVVLILVIVFLGTGGVKTAANETLEQIQNGNLEAVYNDSALVSVMSYNDFAANMGVGTPMSIVNAELKGWNGRGFEGVEKYIYGTFVFENGQEEILTFWFQEVEDDYILLGITGGAPETMDY